MGDARNTPHAHWKNVPRGILAVMNGVFEAEILIAA